MKDTVTMTSIKRHTAFSCPWSRTAQVPSFSCPWSILALRQSTATHTFGSPVYVLDNKLQAGKRIGKLELPRPTLRLIATLTMLTPAPNVSMIVLHVHSMTLKTQPRNSCRHLERSNECPRGLSSNPPLNSAFVGRSNGSLYAANKWRTLVQSVRKKVLAEKRRTHQNNKDHG